ncbi:GNAT family N-acetyltransferase [Planobispora rosea]|uniref:GNAT family N-acetyltransferase n=1 Tax=Planobispora rosea TaxID=35762 RepID=UPI000B0B3D8A|nr:GNAT family N-acetyltransferase [Planobispora rosea]
MSSTSIGTVDRLSAGEFSGSVGELAVLLADTVADGASLGFVSPFDQEAAAAWWRTRAPAVADGSLAVWVCRDAGGINATVSLALTGKPNGRHRAEIVKLMVHPGARGRGLARALLATAEAAAAAAGITLLILDTETASAAEHLYLAEGWTRYGIVPAYAASPDGSLKDCSFFYKELTSGPGAPA